MLLSAVGGAAFAQLGDALTLRGAGYEIGFDRRTGHIAFLRVSGNGAAQPDICATPPGGSLWQLTFRGGGALRSADFAQRRAGTVRVKQTMEGALRLTYESKAATVVVEAAPRDDGIDLSLRVTAASDDVLTVSFPADLSFAPSGLRRVLFPNDLGIALRPGFFLPQADPARWETVRIGPAGLQRVAGSLGIPLTEGESAAKLSVTERGRALLGDVLSRAWQGHTVSVSRPARPEPDLPLLASAKGIWFGGHTLGRGRLLRFAGPVKAADAPLVVPTVAQVLAALTPRLPLPEMRERGNPIFTSPDPSFVRRGDRLPSPARAAGNQGERSGVRANRVLLLAMRRGPASGGWAGMPVEYWRNHLLPSDALRAAGLETAAAETVPQMLDALRDPKTFAVVNPYGESLPVGSARWEDVADAVRRFIEGGGVWIETGGHPFYSALKGHPFFTIEANYPGGFSDFAAIETTGGAACLYGVQDAADPKTILVPSFWRAWGDERGGHLERAWRTLVRKGKTWLAPPVRLRVSPDSLAALQAYARDNKLVRPLADTVPAGVLEKWKRAVLVAYLGETYAAQARGLDLLPPGSIVHLADFLRGGFDKQYPDLLPPNPARGTLEEFRALVDRIHALGGLFMPYTNHTWWCDDPKGPTFLANGDAPLLRTLDGELAHEDYAGNGGWSVCPWHPAVIAAAGRIVDQFTQEYPADILFQDQVGARSWIGYDLNPASPTPWAYNQGWVNLARRQAKRIPLATEHGFDRLIGGIAEFCGLTWQLVPFEETPAWLAAWLRPYRDRFAPEDWEFFPMAQFVAGFARGSTTCSTCGALFANHLGGPFVTNREVLLWSLALGFQMTYRTSPSTLENPYARNWLFYLDQVQKAISARCMGKPLASFRYLKGSGASGVLESVFGDTRVVANLTADPYTSGDVEIAPMGFFATAPGLEAGILSAYGGRRYENGLWLFREEDGPTTRFTVYANAPVELAVPIENAANRQADPPDALLKADGGHLNLRLSPLKRNGADVPEEWLRAAPLQRRTPPKYIGVLNVQPDSDALYLWAQVKAAEWLAALRDCAPVREGKLEARLLATADDLWDALSRPDEWLGIVNPYGERIPVSERHDARAVVAAVGEYVRRGGLWFETGGYPFFSALVARNGRWVAEPVGPGPMYALGLSGCRIRAEDEMPVRLEATDLGTQWLGAEWANALRGQAVFANRPPLEEDCEAVLAKSSGGAPYVVGHQLGGYGWLFRIAGRDAPAAVALPTVKRLIETLAARPLASLPPKTAPELVTVQLERR